MFSLVDLAIIEANHIHERGVAWLTAARVAAARYGVVIEEVAAGELSGQTDASGKFLKLTEKGVA